MVSRNAKEALVAPMVWSGGVCFWRVSGVSSQQVCFVLVHLIGVKVFSHSVYFAENFHKFFTFVVNSKYNAAISYINVQHKNVHSCHKTYRKNNFRVQGLDVWI